MTRAGAVRAGERLGLEWADGAVEAIAASAPGEGTVLAAPKRRSRRGEPGPAGGNQGSLF